MGYRKAGNSNAEEDQRIEADCLPFMGRSVARSVLLSEQQKAAGIWPAAFFSRQ
jgi:hypothetical protein